MKAIVCTKYGSPDVLELKEVVKPSPEDNEVLVKVIASSVNFANLAFVKGEPFMIRFMAGFFKPKYRIPGGDFAGRVEAIGKNVNQFKPGDEVFGDIGDCGFGAFAEYASVPENELAIKPNNISFNNAAAVPQAALVALQGLRDKGNIQPGQKVLIIGASSGNGTFAVQIAKHYGAEVTGVCGTNNIDMVRSIGADDVIDYTKEDFTKNGEKYDLILANAGYRPLGDYKRSLNPQGTYVMTGGSMKQIMQANIFGPFLSKSGGKKLNALSHKTSQKDLILMKELIESGKVKPIIDRTYPLSEVAEALRYYGEGHASGKVVITLEHNNKT